MPTHSRYLIGWKQVAAYLEVSAKTAKRWSHLYGLPIARLSPGGTVRARPEELDAWWDSKKQPGLEKRECT